MNEVVRRWLNHMKLAYVPMFACFTSLLVFIPVAYVFAIHLEMEIAGLAWAKVI